MKNYTEAKYSTWVGKVKVVIFYIDILYQIYLLDKSNGFHFAAATEAERCAAEDPNPSILVTI
jgi:hypothetical protein